MACEPTGHRRRVLDQLAAERGGCAAWAATGSSSRVRRELPRWGGITRIYTPIAGRVFAALAD